ncbi:MAG: GTP pyrophosphokinase family protein [Lachnospiraceae bacterium]
MTDILGTRVVCYFADDVDVIGGMVEQNFVVDRDNSVDKRKMLQADSFGYLSLHYVCSLPADAGYPREVCGRRFEIQIRTILQHVWDAVNHDMGYKGDFGMPRAVTRQFARLDGLFEIIDEEFMRVRDNMNTYTEQTREKIIHDGAEDVLIDIVSLKEYMLRNRRMRAFLQKVADIEHSEIYRVNPENYLLQLKWLQINTIGDLQRMLEENEELALKIARDALGGTELDIISSNVALRFLCRARLLSGGYSEQQAAQFFALTIGNEERAKRQAKQLYQTYDAGGLEKKGS